MKVEYRASSEQISLRIEADKPSPASLCQAGHVEVTSRGVKVWTPANGEVFVQVDISCPWTVGVETGADVKVNHV